MGNILKDINNPDLINPFDIVKGRIKGNTEVISFERVPDDSDKVKSLLNIDKNAEHIKMINKLSPPTHEPTPKLDPEVSKPVYDNTVTSAPYDKEKFIYDCIKFLKFREDKYDIVEEIKSLI